MRTSFLKFGILCLFLLLGLPGRPNSPLSDAERAETRSRPYQQAYLEMAAMLDGRSPLSIKRAVFLAEGPTSTVHWIMTSIAMVCIEIR